MSFVGELKELGNRWANFFEFLRFANNIPGASITIEEMERLSRLMETDRKGQEMFLRSMMKIMLGSLSESDKSWLISEGIFSPTFVRLEENMAELRKKIEKSDCDEEKRLLQRSLDRLLNSAEKGMATSKLNIVRSLEKLKL